MDLDWWLAWSDLFKAMLTPTLAVVGAVIALQQVNTARNKLRLELFDRRWPIYQATMKAIGEVVKTGKSSPQIEYDLLSGTRGVEYVFGRKVWKYIDGDVLGKLQDLATVEGEIAGLQPGLELDEAIQKRTTIKNWFTAQLMGNADRHFEPLIRLRG